MPFLPLLKLGVACFITLAKTPVNSLGLPLLSKLINFAWDKGEWNYVCTGEFADQQLRFAMDKKTVFATKGKVRNYIYSMILPYSFYRNCLLNPWSDLDAFVNLGISYLKILISWTCSATISYLICIVVLITTEHLYSYSWMNPVMKMVFILFLVRGLRIRWN